MASNRRNERKQRSTAVPVKAKRPALAKGRSRAPTEDLGDEADDAAGISPSPAALPICPAEVNRLVRVARENPYRFFTLTDVAKICGFGPDILTALNSLGAPIVGRKCNPQLLLEWIGRNSDKIGKIRG
jgi:hypothetical protein